MVSGQAPFFERRGSCCAGTVRKRGNGEQLSMGDLKELPSLKLKPRTNHTAVIAQLLIVLL